MQATIPPDFFPRMVGEQPRSTSGRKATDPRQPCPGFRRRRSQDRRSLANPLPFPWHRDCSSLEA